MIEVTKNKIVRVVAPLAIVDNASWTTTEIDTLGFAHCQVVVHLGATDIAMAALKLQESDITGAGQTDITGMDFSISATLPSATDDNKFFAFTVNLLGRKRFLTLVATAGDGATGTFLTAMAILSRAQEVPNSATDRGFSQELSV